MKLFLCLLFTSYCLLLVVSPARAVYDPSTLPNNKIGVHILSPSELALASALVNSQGGDWGYVTIPIQPTDRDPVKWQSFLDTCRSLHLIPIIRITTIPRGGTWADAEATDLVDFANFLSALRWPTGNRYIVLFNEVNRQEEWGGSVDPSAYADILRNAHKIFKERSPDYFLLGPSLDAALPNSKTSRSAASYIQAMRLHDPKVFTYLDGWSSHSYPNPAFRASPSKRGLGSIASYSTELSLAGVKNLPVFITETGWDISLPAKTLASNWQQALAFWQKDSRVIAVTPFILEGGDQFNTLSLLKKDGSPSVSYQEIFAWQKNKGASGLELAKGSTPTSSATTYTSGSTKTPFDKLDILLKLENFFRRLFGLMPRAHLSIGDQLLSVELAENAKDWTQGLSGRDDLAKGEGMLFIFPSAHIPSFWMKDMNFDLDIIWINRGLVVDITKNVPRPQNSSDNLPTYSPAKAVDTVLEVPAGYATEINLQVGDQIILSK